jgi:hypothetical protein
MKKLLTSIIVILLTAILSNTAIAQSFSGIQWDWYDIAARTAVATGNKHIVPDSCAALQIGKDTTKYGLLLPRVVDTAIAGQKKGLLAYRLQDNNIYFHNGVKWTSLQACCEGSSGNIYDTLNYYYDETTLINYVTAKLQLTALKADSNTWYPTMHYVNSFFSTGTYRYYCDTLDGTVAGQTKFIFKTKSNKGRFIIDRIRLYGLDVPSISLAGILSVGTNFPNYDDIENISLPVVPLNTTLPGNSSTITIPPNTNVYARIATPATGSNVKISVYISGYYQKD